MARTKRPRPRRTTRPVDVFTELLKAGMLSHTAEYRPMVGYLYSDGSVVNYSPQNAAWYSLDRAISSCFGSAARRMRGTWDATYHKRGVVVAFLMMVIDSRNKVVWKARVDIPNT